MLKAVNRSDQFVHLFFCFCILLFNFFYPYQYLLMWACGVCGQAFPPRVSSCPAVQVLWANRVFFGLSTRRQNPQAGFAPRSLFSRQSGVLRSTFYSVSLGQAGAKISERFPLPVSIYRHGLFRLKGGHEVRDGGTKSRSIVTIFFSSIHPRFFSIAFQQRGIPHRFVS